MIDTADLQPGDLIAFRLRPLRFSSSPHAGCWGAARVIAVRDGFPVVSILDGLWNAAPSPEEAASAAPLVPVRHAGSHISQLGTYDIAVFLLAWTPRIPDAEVIARGRPLDPAEAAVLAELEADTFGAEQGLFHGPMSDWTYPSLELGGEVWFRDDPGGWQADQAQVEAGWRTEWDAAEARRRTRLRGLTLATLLSETPLRDFGDPLPEAFVTEARARVRATEQALADLGPKPRRPAVRKVLRALVEWFNAHEDKIETVERETLFQHLEELCWATGQKALVPEIDEWRTW